MSALRSLLEGRPLKDLDDVNLPLLRRVAVFSAKVRALQKVDAPQLDAADPFLFLFDGENMDGKPETKLAAFPVSELFDDTTIAVETNISTYSIPAGGNSQGQTGYTMPLQGLQPV